MDDRVERPRRLDLHNISVDFAVASAGGCGFTDLDTGRVCRLPHRHGGQCELRGRHVAARPAAASQR